MKLAFVLESQWAEHVIVDSLGVKQTGIVNNYSPELARVSNLGSLMISTRVGSTSLHQCYVGTMFFVGYLYFHSKAP